MTREQWVQTMLDRAADAVRGAVKGQQGGGRHDTIVREAYKLGPYVRDGHLPESRALAVLGDAGRSAGKPAQEVDRAVRDSIAAGATDIGECWWPDADDRSTAIIAWPSAKGGTVRVPRVTREQRDAAEAAGRQVERAAIEVSVCDLDMTQIPVALTPAPGDDGPLWVTLWPAAQAAAASRTQGRREEWTWARLAAEVGDPLQGVTDKLREAPMWGPHTLEGDSRARGAVPEVWTALVLDYDDDPEWSVQRCAEDWWADVRHVAHTSWSHQVDKKGVTCPRGRVVVALSRAVSPEEAKGLGAWAIGCGRGKPGGEATDAMRAYVVPCARPGYESRAHDPGRVLDVDAMLARIEAAREGLGKELETKGPDPDVLGRLDCAVSVGADGTVRQTPRGHLVNVARVLREDRRWDGRLVYDEFAEEGYLDGRPVTDVDLIRIMEWVGEVYGLHAPKDRIVDAVRLVSHENATNVVREYLDGLVWDGTPRVQRLLWHYMGCENSPDGLSQAYARRWAISCVARIQRPGCKVDTMLILKGPQGARKSSAFAALAGEWFSDSPIKIGTDDAPQALQGVWIYEIAELDSMARKDATQVKSFLAASVDRFHVRYDRMWTTRPRQSVCVGTTNEDAFLSDPTGSRRFWPREVVRPIRIDELRRDRDQLWAEAMHLYRAGEQWWLTDAEEAARIESSGAYEAEDAWEADLLHKTSGGEWFRLPDLMGEVLDCAAGKVRKGDLMKAGRFLRSRGYEKEKRTWNDVRAIWWRAPG